MRHHRFHERLGDHLARVGQAEDQRVEDHRGSEDDPGLKAAAGAEVAMELDVEREQENERDDHLGHHAQDQVVPHRLAFLARRRRSNATTPAPAVNTTVVSPKRVVAAVAREHGRDDVRHRDFLLDSFR